ncbi:MAG: C40 family peptidase [Lachnospiraceae bacterium]|nr:C40 family peptidase [Lachnospiraceae bacterium]MDY5496437.1 C40 family peptidase [Anaerobutyricum sp.]
MKRKFGKVAYYFTLTCLMMSFILLGNSKDVTAATRKYVTASDLSIRKSATSSSKKVGSYKRGTLITCYGNKGSWTKVKYKGKTRYVYSKYLSSSKPSATTGSTVVAYAKNFVGNPYRYGGTSLTGGTDCSGFTQSVYKHFGYNLPRTSKAQRKAGVKVSGLRNAKAGDLVCYYGHVALYMGGNKIIHASSPKTGIKISSNAAYRKIASIRRIIR